MRQRADDERGVSDDTAGEDDEAGGGDEIKDPEKKALHDEAAKWRKHLRVAESRIQELEDANNAEAFAAENNELRLRLAFERAAGEFVDLDAARKLAQDQLATVEIKDGTPDATRVGEIVRQVANRYSYLVDGPAAPQVPTAADLAPARSAMNGRKGKRAEVSQKAWSGSSPHWDEPADRRWD